MHFCFAWISEQTAIISPYSINLPVFYNRGRKCLLRGTNWVFKSDSYSFVLKNLICVISVIMLNFFLFTIYIYIHIYVYMYIYIPITILALRSTVKTITHQDVARLSVMFLKYELQPRQFRMYTKWH
jgi:hypothetical protein